jgi:hypothetical protein
MAALLGASRRVQPGEELAEQVAQLPPPVGGQPRPQGQGLRRR